MGRHEEELVALKKCVGRRRVAGKPGCSLFFVLVCLFSVPRPVPQECLPGAGLLSLCHFVFLALPPSSSLSRHAAFDKCDGHKGSFVRQGCRRWGVACWRLAKPDHTDACLLA